MAHVSLDPGADTGVLSDGWLTASAERLRQEAALHYGACDEGDLHPDGLEWRLVIDLPLDALVPLMGTRAGWSDWFAAELAMFDEEHPHVADGYRALMEEPLEDPVVVTLDGARVQIWDGWHRTATRILGGAVTIPAIVGLPPGGPALTDLVARRTAIPAE